MRILHVYKDYSPVLGGIENHVRLLAEGQAARGHAVVVLVTNPAGLPTRVSDENGVCVVRAGRLATLASTPLSAALPWHLKRRQTDIVHLHYPYPVGETSQWLVRQGRATVMTYHSDVVRQAGILRFYRPLLARVLNQVDAFIVGSPPMRGSPYLAAHQDRVHLIPYGLPLDRFLAEPAAADLERTRLRYLGHAPPEASQPPLDSGARPGAPGLPLLLFVGRLRYYKGLDVLLRALPQIPARLVVAGSGPMAGTWQALAASTGVADRVSWLGEVPDPDLPGLYHLADLFVLPASHPSEAFGLVQVEAMAAGLPVVCTELGTGTSYVNLDGITGRVVPPNDPLSLASAINTLLANRSLLAQMAVAGRARVQAEFGLDAMIERVLTLYEQLLAS